MKLKQILVSIVLILSLSLPTFALADDNEVIISTLNPDFAFAYDVATQLNLTDGMQDGFEKPATRAQVATMALRAINMADLTPKDDGFRFKDISSSIFANEITVAKELGITSGTSDGLFSPDAKVGVEAIAKMMVSALGYTSKAVALGGYPYGYMKIARDLNLLDGVDTSKTYITLQDAYVILYNTLIAPVAIYTGVDNGDLQISSIEGRSLLTENFKLKLKSGVITSVGLSSVDTGFGEKGKIAIGTFIVDTDLDADKFLGSYADIWYSEKDNKAYVVALSKDNKEVVYDAKDFISYSNLTVTFDVEGKDKKYKLSPDVTFMLNGENTAFDETTFAFYNGTIKLIDNNNDSKYEYVIAESKKYFVISSVDTVSDVIYDRNSDYKSIEFDFDDIDTDYNIYVDGIKVTDFSKVPVNSAAEVYMSQNKKICKVYVSTNTISGVYDGKGTDYILIDGEYYDVNNYFKTYAPVNMGISYTFAIAPDSTVTQITSASESNMQYGMLLNVGKSLDMDQTPKIRVLNTSNNILELTLSDKINLNGTVMENDDSRITDALKNGSVVKQQLIKFKAKDGLVTNIDTSVDKIGKLDMPKIPNENNSLARYVKNDKFYYTTNTKNASGLTLSSALLMEVPTDFEVGNSTKYDESRFEFVSIDQLINGTYYTVDAYDLNEDFVSACILVKDNQGESSIKIPSNNAPSYVVMSVTDAINQEGDVCKLLRLYGEKKYVKYYIDDTTYKTIVNSQGVPNFGDVVRLSFATDGSINGLVKDVKFTSLQDKLNVNYANGNSSSGSGVLSFWTGNAYSLGKQTIGIRKEVGPSSYTGQGFDGVYSLPLLSTTYILVDTKLEQVKLSSSAQLVTEINSSASEATKIAVRTYYYGARVIIMYK